MMRVTTLGGSAAGANTGMACSGLLVRTATTTALVDLGPGTFPELRRHVDFRALDGIVISHLHLDHTLDLGTMRYALAYNPQPGNHPFFAGGYIVQRHAAAAGTPKVDGLQIECPRPGVRDTPENRARFGRIAAPALLEFLRENYGYTPAK